jgi:hypothetical protein
MMRLLSLFRSRALLDVALRQKLVPVASLRTVDAAVLAELQRRSHEPVTDIGEPFESTDVIVDGHLPTRRFVVAGHTDMAPSVWVVCYACGGRFRYFQVAVLQVQAEGTHVLKSGRWHPDWAEWSQWKSPDGDWPSAVPLDRVLTALRKNEVDSSGSWVKW